MITTAGKNFLADQITQESSAAMTHMAIGTGATAEQLAVTTLQAEVARVALTSKTSSSNIASFVATFPAGTGTGTITEVAILNASSNGTMLLRKTFGAITKSAGASLTLTIQITQN